MKTFIAGIAAMVAFFSVSWADAAELRPDHPEFHMYSRVTPSGIFLPSFYKTLGYGLKSGTLMIRSAIPI